MLYIHILTINDFQGGVKCAVVCVFLKKTRYKKRGFIYAKNHGHMKKNPNLSIKYNI